MLFNTKPVIVSNYFFSQKNIPLFVSPLFSWQINLLLLNILQLIIAEDMNFSWESKVCRFTEFKNPWITFKICKGELKWFLKNNELFTRTQFIGCQCT